MDGWVKEGTAFYSASSSGVPIYRVYNSNQFAFNHHYTKSEQESKHLTQLGWSDEGIAFYGMNDSTTPETSTVTINYIDTTGNKIKDSTTESVESGKDFTATAPSISEYTIQGETSQTLTNVTSNQSITFTYQKNASTTNYTVTVNYIDANDPTKTVAEATTEIVKEGDSFTAPVVADYTVNNQKPTSTVITEDTILTFEYVSNTTVFSFSTSADHSATITGFAEGKEATDIVIPNYVSDNKDTYQVTRIGIDAFYNKSLTSVSIPKNGTAIEDLAFYGNQITNVTISNSVLSIGVSAFANNQLVNVTIPNSVKSIAGGAFMSNKIETVTIPEGVKIMERSTFYRNQLKSITIPNSVESIADYAFYLNQLTEITIPDNVTFIGEAAFKGNPDLKTASVPSGYTDNQGAFNKTITNLVPRS